MGASFEVVVMQGRDEKEPPFLIKRPAPSLRERREGVAALDREWQVLQKFRLSRFPTRLDEGFLDGSSLPKPLFRGEDERGPFLAESIVPGVPLRKVAEGGPIPMRSFQTLASAAFLALAELHECADERGPLGFVHGDPSPDNVFLDETPSGARVSFVDFGDAIFRDAPEPVFPHMRGTLPYAAPELVRGEASPTQATDVYALAASLLTLVLPRLTHASSEPAMLLEVGERGLNLDALASRPDLEPSVKETLLRAVAFDPARRIASARELARALAHPA